MFQVCNPSISKNTYRIPLLTIIRYLTLLIIVCHQNAEAYSMGHKEQQQEQEENNSASSSSVHVKRGTRITSTATRRVNRRLVGGYNQVSMENGDEMMHGAVEFMLDEIKQGNGPRHLSFSSAIKNSAALKQNHHDGGTTTNNDNDNQDHMLDFVPLEISQQVVAGLNYKIKIGVFVETSTRQQNSGDDGGDGAGHSSDPKMKKVMAETERCLGGISAIVYRSLQGDYSLTLWGKEIDCQQVLVLLNEHVGDE